MSGFEAELDHHIVTFGRTGVGKSWTGNVLSAPGQDLFEEDDGDESCTTEISTNVAFNGDLVSDVPGYFDTEGRDAIQQANFVDFIRGKSIRAIVFVFTDKIDSFMASAVQAFKQTQLASNIILVKNKMLTAPAVEVESGFFEGLTKINVRAHQRNLDVLKHHIHAMTPVMVTELVSPVSLFNQPLEIVNQEHREEFVETRVIPTVVQMSRTVQVPVQRDAWDGPAWLGRKKYWTEYHDRTETYDQVVDKSFRVYNRYLYTYAVRFDGETDTYSKEMVEIVTREI